MTTDSTSNHAYICSGAMLRCDKGTLPARLYVPPTRTLTIGGQPWANTNDRDPVLNQLNLGVCLITQKPCPLTIRPLRWQQVKQDVEVAGAPALLDCSRLPCALGGIISFDYHGQPAV